jgi:hypothetical protein
LLRQSGIAFGADFIPLRDGEFQQFGESVCAGLFAMRSFRSIGA